MSQEDVRHQQEVARLGAEDSGRYFRYMAEFVGFTDEDAAAVRETRPVIARHLPRIVADFYTHLLRYPATRKFFLKKDGSIDQPYLKLRMRHLSNFWLRTADGLFDDEYARYVDYVGRAHTSRGADPSIYIADRYVIGQVGMIQHAISDVLSRELRHVDSELEFRAVEAWDKLMMVILEMLARAYGYEREAESFAATVAVDKEWVAELAARAVAREQEDGPPRPTREVAVAAAADVPDGERRIIRLDGLTIGLFHQQGEWFALENSCIHRGGPVATGPLVDNILTCPWHGFQFDLRTGRALADPDARLDSYPVTIRDGQVYLTVPLPEAPAAGAVSPAQVAADLAAAATAVVADVVKEEAAGSSPAALQPHQFRVADVPPGRIKALLVNGVDVAVYNIDGQFYATQDECTHAYGPLSEGDLDGPVITCFLHGSCFDVTSGAVLCGPATEPLQRYRVTVDEGVGSVAAMENE